jgi:hypothetical protein
MKKFLLIFFLLVTTAGIQAQTVYITNTGAKYHQKSCQHLKRSSIEISLQDAINRGYDPCKVCRPTTKVVQKAAQTSSSSSSSSTTSSQNLSSTTESTTSVQCSGTTKEGKRCKRMTTNSNGRCWQH